MIFINKRKFIFFCINFILIVFIINYLSNRLWKNRTISNDNTNDNIIIIEDINTENTIETTTDIEITTQKLINDDTIHQPTTNLQQEQLEEWCYSDEDLLLLSRLIDAEAGDECTDEHKLYVGQVVLNRIQDERFPDTLEEVIYQVEPQQQYASIDNIDFYDYPSERSIQCAKKLLNGENITTEPVIWQSEFPQGTVVKVFKTKYSTTYICK